jgi:hypothetical protein
VKSWPWSKILAGIGGLLVLVGVAPFVCLLWWGTTHNFEPLAFPLTLKRGEYTSPVFKTDLNEPYQIQIYFLPQHNIPLDLDWKIVDDSGAAIQSGAYLEEHLGGNSVNLGEYRPRRGSHQKIIVNIHHDVDAAGSDLKLHIGVPEESLGMAYGAAAAIGWAAIVAGAGAIMLLVLLIRRAMQPKVPLATR